VFSFRSTALVRTNQPNFVNTATELHVVDALRYI